MKVLIYDSSLVPDISYQQRIVNLFTNIAEISVKFATGILEATWHIRNFRPDVILFDWICDSKQIRKLVTMLHRIKPDVAMFHLNLGGIFVATSPYGFLAETTVPFWLKNISPHWILAGRTPI